MRAPQTKNALRRLLALTSMLLVAATAAAQTNIVTNGSFESPGFGFTGNTDNFRYLNDAGDSRIAGWTTSRNQVPGERAYWFHSSRYPVFDGQYGLSLTDGSQAQTIVSVAAGRTYDLTFYLSRDLSPPVSDYALDVSLGSIRTTLLPGGAFDTGRPVGNGQNWLKYEWVVVTPTSGATLLKISNVPNGISTFDGGVTIDNVIMTAVPEPGILAMFIAGLGAILVGRRKLRRQI